MAKIIQGQTRPFSLKDDIILNTGLSGVPIKFGIEGNIDAEFTARLAGQTDTFILKLGRTGIYESDDFISLASLIYTNEGSFKIKDPVLDYVVGDSV